MQIDKTPYKESTPCYPFNIMSKCSIESMNLVDVPGVRVALGSEQHVVGQFGRCGCVGVLGEVPTQLPHNE